MTRYVWVIGAAGAAVVALIAAPRTHDDGAATAQPTTSIDATLDIEQPATTAPATTAITTTVPATVQAATTQVTTTDVPQTSTSLTSSTTLPTATSPTSTTALSPLSGSKFNGRAFDDVIAGATVDAGDVAAGVAVMRDGAVLHTAAFGMENPFESKPATAATRFRIASVSKMFTAVAIMQLVEDGTIELNESFTGQLGLDGPFNDPRLAAVTVRQLLSHTSGFPVSYGIFFGHGVETWRQAATSALDQTLLFDPGTAFRYSNMNYCLLGMLLEAVTGQQFESVIRERVLDPIGADAHLAPTFDTVDGDALHASVPTRNYMETLGPAGGWVASPVDIAKLASALRPDSAGVRLLDQATVAMMRTPVPVPISIPPPDDGWNYGLGLILFGDGSWGHTGTIESTHAIVVNRPDGLTVVVLVSGDAPGETDDLVQVIDRAVIAGSVVPH